MIKNEKINFGKVENTDMLKIVAMVTMFIDHIGAYLLPDFILLRIIGRLAFPIFAYLVVLGVHRTSNMHKYSDRLFKLALLTTIITGLFNFNIFPLNIVWMFWLYVELAIRRKIWLYLLFIPIAFIFDYGLYGILIMAIFTMLVSSDIKFKYDWLLLPIISFFLSLLFYGTLQAFSILAFILIYKLKDYKNMKRLPKISFYFYPGHLFIVYLVSSILR